MGKLVAASEKYIPSMEEARAEILERLENWRCNLVAYDRGLTNLQFSRPEIVGKLDMWLERLADVGGIHCMCGPKCKERTYEE